MKTKTTLMFLLLAVLMFATGCLDVAEVGSQNYREQRRKFTIEVTPHGVTSATTYWCNSYDRLVSQFDGGTVLQLNDCSPSGGGYTFSWPKGFDGPTYEVK